MSSWIDKDEIRTEMNKTLAKEVDFLRRNFLIQDVERRLQEPSSPIKPAQKTSQGIKRQGTLAMTFTTISPKNQYKKILSLAKDKQLNNQTCNMVRGYQNVKKHKLFQLRAVSTLKPVDHMLRQRQKEEVLKIRL